MMNNMSDMNNKYTERPWRKMQDIGCIPETLMPYPDVSYTEFILEKNVKKYPNELALVQFDYEITYKKLKEHVDKFATALAGLGIKKGDVVATSLPTSIQFIIADLAIPKLGAIHLPTSMLDSEEGLVDKFERSNCKAVVCVRTNVKDRDIVDKVKKAAGQTKVENIIVTEIRDYSKNPPEWTEDGVLKFNDLIKNNQPNPPKVNIDPKNDVAVLFFTGGTTGRPKGVMLTHYNLVSRTLMSLGSNFPQSLLNALVDGYFTQILMLPIFHVFGHEFYEFFMGYGCTLLIVTDPRDTKEFVRLAKEYHPLFTPAAPTHLIKLTQEESLSSLGILALSGSMPLAPQVQKEFEEKSGSVSFDAYGMSETGGATCTPTALEVMAPLLGGFSIASKLWPLTDKLLTTPGVTPLMRSALGLIGRRNFGILWNNVIALASSLIRPVGVKDRKTGGGRVGYPFVDEKIKIINDDTGETIPISKVVSERLRGEFCVKGPNTMIGYWPEPGSGLDNDGYVHSGDIVMIDDDGGIRVVDRTKDMVNISGYKVYSVELDNMLYEYPGISEAAVVGVPDPERPGSERLKVFVSLKPGYKGKITEGDLINYLKERVPKYAVPRSVEFRDELPKTDAEKIFKRRLRDEEINKMKKEGLIKE